jgi:uncharacterized protein (DUF2141 family)
MRRAPSRTTRCGMVAAAVLASAGIAFADSPLAKDVISFRVTGLRNNAGRVGCGLWASKNGFPKDRSKALQMKWCPIASGEALCAFDPVGAGRYAIACFHDENGNSALDTTLFGIPTEGFVASNHARGFMGPPSFKDASFAFAAQPTELREKIRY